MVGVILAVGISGIQQLGGAFFVSRCSTASRC
jgi:hypothetical protein